MILASSFLQGGFGPMIIWVVFLVGMMYFMIIRPQQKEKKKQEELMASLAVGDAVLTTAGFYGQIIDIAQDTVIVEFGNNKNCRIPMKKSSIVRVEKPNLESTATEPVTEQKPEEKQ